MKKFYFFTDGIFKIIGDDYGRFSLSMASNGDLTDVFIVASQPSFFITHFEALLLIRRTFHTNVRPRAFREFAKTTHQLFSTPLNRDE